MFRAPYLLLDDGYVQSARFGTGIDSIRRAQEVSKRIILTPGENYTMSVGDGDVITGTDEDVDIIGDNSTFTIVQGADSFIDIAGTYSDELLVSAINGNILTVPGGIGSLVKGDVIKLADDITPPWWVQGRTRRGEYGTRRSGEHTVVKAASGTTLTIPSTPKWSTDRTPEYMREINRIDIAGVTNNGAGLCRVQTTHPHFLTTGLNVTVENVGGVTAANGTRQAVVVDSTHLDLVGSTFSGTYTSGGTMRKSLTYSTHAAAAMKVGKLRSGLCRVRIGRILCASTVTSHGHFVRGSVRKNIDWKATYIQRSASYIFFATSCFGGSISYYADGTGPGNTGYIGAIGGGDGISVYVNGSGTTRHTIDGGLATTANGVTGLAASGASHGMNIYIQGGNIGSTQAAHATHDGTDSWNWYFPKARQTAGNVGVRGIGHTVFGGRSIGSGSGEDDGDDETPVSAPESSGTFGTFAQFYLGVISAQNNGSGLIRLLVDGRAGRGPDLATGMKVRVGSATGSAAASTNGDWYITVIGTTASVTTVDLEGSTFVTASGAENAMMDAGLDGADDFTLSNVMMEDIPLKFAGANANGGKMTIQGGIWKSVGDPSGGVIWAGRELKVRGLDLEFAGSPVGRIFAISFFTTSVDINGLTIDAAGTLPPLVDINTRMNIVDVQVHNVTITNRNGAMAALYRNASTGVGSLPPAGSRFGNIIIYGDLTEPATGKTWTDFAPFVDGPIYVNGEKVADAPDA